MFVSTEYFIDEQDLQIRIEVDMDGDCNFDWVRINLVELGDAIDAAQKTKEETNA